jgi:integrase
MGAIRKRGKIWWIRYSRGGKRFEESTGSAKEADAKRLLKLREGDIERGAPITPRMSRLTVNEAIMALLTEYKVNGRRTHGDLKRRLERHLGPFFGHLRVATVTTADINRYIAKRQEEKAANATINRELSGLKRALTLLVRGGQLLAKPHIPMLREDNVRQGFFEREPFEAMRAHLPTELRPLVTVAYVTGWRVQSELLGLEWRQVDRKACIIRLEPGTTKNRHGRTFDYSEVPEVKTAIDDQWAEHERLRLAGRLCPLVFHRSGRRIRDFRHAWDAACTAAACPGRLIHDLRRTAVRNLVRAGVPERTAMTISGHKTRSVFDRYDIVSEADIREAGRRLAALTGTILGTAASKAAK